MIEIQNPALKNIWQDRYQKNNETIDENIKRVAGYIATNNDEYESFYKIMSNGEFFPAGRTMSNAGVGETLTLNNCFKAGSKVQTIDGFKNIEDIVIGDMVLAADNQYHKVVNTMVRDYYGDIYHLKSKYFYDDIYCTPNHKFLTQNGWIRADRLMTGRRVSSPDKLKMPFIKFNKEYQDIDITINFPLDDKTRLLVNDDNTVVIERLCNKNRFNNNINWMKVNNPVNRIIKLTPDVRYLIGRWIGDGSITRYKGKRNHTIIQIVFNATTEREAAIKCMEVGNKAFGFDCEWRETNQNIISLRWNNEILATWFYQEFGEKCDKKHIGEKYIGDLEIAKGLFDADGCIRTHGDGTLTLKNENLIQWFRDTMFLNGYNTFKCQSVNGHDNTYKVSYSTFVGKRGFNQQLNKTYHDKRMNKENIDKIFTDYICIDSIDVEENQQCKVYNLSVEDEHSYTVNGVVVHNCFLHPIVEDSMEGIFDAVKCGAVTHKAGGGIGYDFSQIRPNGTPTSNQAIASGVVSFMDVFNAQTATVMQGSRRGANMGVLSVYHPDIFEFIHAKEKDTSKLNHFNLSVMVDDAFMKAVENNELVYLHYPVYDEQYHIITDKSRWMQVKEVKAVDLWNDIMQLAYNNGEPGVLFYDNMNKDNNTWYTETITHTNPCGEFVGGTIFNGDLPANNYGGACNLGSLFLHNFVHNPFKSNAYFNFSRLAEVIPIAVRMLDNIIDINKYPLSHYENYQKNLRTVGLGVTGLADALAMLGYKYNSKEATEFVDTLMESIAICAYTSSIDLSKEKGCFPFFDAENFVQSGYILKHLFGKNSETWKQIKEDILTYGIRNARLMSIAPTGTLSLTFGNNCSSGIEPIFSLSYDRKVKVGGQDDKDVQTITIQDYAYHLYQQDNKPISSNVFVTALDMTVNEHIDMLAAIAKHVDMSVSKTINVPTDYSFEDTKNIYMRCWKEGIKGCTIFRPNSVRQGILIDNSNKTSTQNIECQADLARGDWNPKADDTTYYQRKLRIGCGKLFLFIGWSDSEQCIQDFYVTRSGQGGCERLLQATAISMSAIFRLGGNIENIEKAFRGVGGCNSFATQRGKGEKLSSGSSCGVAILNELKAFLKERRNSKEEVKPVKKVKIQEKQKEVKSNNKTIVSKCPECGEHTLVFEGGCNCCRNCGFSSCG